MRRYSPFLITIALTFSLGQSSEICDCYTLGTLEDSEGQSICSPYNLQCKCLPNVEGINCDKCKEGYYNIISGVGCVSCECDPTGTVPNTLCDHRGKCHCKEGYEGYRCNINVENSAISSEGERCMCGILISDFVEEILQKLREVQDVIKNLDKFGQDNWDKFEKKLQKLRRLLHNLKNNVLDELSKTVAYFHIDSELADLKEINNKLLAIISRLPRGFDINMRENEIEYMERLLVICKSRLQEVAEEIHAINDHNDEITAIAQFATALGRRLEKLPHLIDETIYSYHMADENVKVLEDHLSTLTKFLEYNKQHYEMLRKKLSNLKNSSENNKIRALENKEILDRISLPLRNSTRNFCDFEIPTAAFEIPTNLLEILKNAEATQAKINDRDMQMERLKERMATAVESNKRDIKQMETIYLKYLNLAGTLTKSSIFDTETLSNKNEAERKLIEKELNDLISKLDEFVSKLIDMERLNQKNWDLLKKFQEDVKNMHRETELLKELEIFFDALPMKNEQLDAVEKEIEQAETYFLLLEEKNRLEEEVKNVQTIAEELDKLGDPRDLCDTGVKPEGQSTNNINTKR